MKKISILFLSILLSSSLFAIENGEVRVIKGEEKAWHEKSNSYISLEAFWRDYAKNSGGLTWGEGREYPDYNKVNEFDLFMVELDSGICLMEFYHSRWRRANDVRRWDDNFNEFSACPNVFN